MRYGPRVISRRGFLKVGLAGGALLSGATVLGLGAIGYSAPPRVAERLVHLSHKEYLVLRACVDRIVGPLPAPTLPLDEYRVATTADADDPALFLDGFLRFFDAPTRRELKGLLHLIEHSTSIFGSDAGGRLRRFTGLTGEEQDQVLREWQSSSLTIRRQCFQGLRSLVFMGFYRDPRTFAALGYDGPTLRRDPPPAPKPIPAAEKPPEKAPDEGKADDTKPDERKDP